MDRIRWLDRGVLWVSLGLLILSATGGAGWTTAPHAALAVGLERAAAAPLYGILAGAATALPVGEIGFRLAVLGAVLGALLLAGVVRAARAWLPRDPVAGAIAALLLFLAPPFRDAVATATPALLAAVGAVWAVAGAAARTPAAAGPAIAGALAAVAVVVGSAPWLGAPLLVLIAAWTWRARPRLVLGGAAAIAGLAVVWWVGAIGSLPAPAASLTAAVAASGRGAAAVVIGGGLLGLAFAAATRLPVSGWFAGAAALAVAHAIAIDSEPAPLLGLLAIGCAVIPSAVVRAFGSDHPQRVAAAAGAPLVLAALLIGPTLIVDDPGDSPARLARDLVADLPPGPGVFVATRPLAREAVRYASAVAGMRPDLVLAAPRPQLDALAANLLRGDQTVGADVAAFGVLDPRRALPRGRGYQLSLRVPSQVPAVAPPPHYATSIGEAEAVAIALARARFEGAGGRLDGAARALGLVDRFRAADLALLSTALPSRTRPAMFGYIPALGTPPGRWQLDLFADDLAWVAGIDAPAIAQPPERQLHALWRQVWAGALPADAPAITTLGPAAVAATSVMRRELTPSPASEPAVPAPAPASEPAAPAPAPAPGSAAPAQGPTSTSSPPR